MGTMNIWKIIMLGMLVMHGLGHITGFLTAWIKLPMGFTEKPWIFSSGVTMYSVLGKVFGLIWLAAMVLFLLAAYNLFTGQAVWLTYAVLASVCSLIVILPWAKTVVPGALYGGTIANLVILLIAFGPWKDKILDLLK